MSNNEDYEDFEDSNSESSIELKPLRKELKEPRKKNRVYTNRSQKKTI